MRPGRYQYKIVHSNVDVIATVLASTSGTTQTVKCTTTNRSSHILFHLAPTTRSLQRHTMSLLLSTFNAILSSIDFSV